jgi:hypothetical protein
MCSSEVFWEEGKRKSHLIEILQVTLPILVSASPPPVGLYTNGNRSGQCWCREGICVEVPEVMHGSE